MEFAIAKYFNYRLNIIVPNISWGFNIHECDIFLIRKSGYVIEIEIKRSIADLKKDFEKKHNHIDKKNRIAEFYYAIPEELYEKAKDLIPENAGIIVIFKYTGSKNREFLAAATRKKAIRIKNARKLTKEEQFRIAVLGTMRIWKLKDKIIKIGKKIVK